MKETDVGTLSTNVGPLHATEATETGPVIDFELAHAMKKDIEGDTEELVSDDNIRVGFVKSD